MDKLKHESTWEDILKHSDPLTLFALIEKTVLAQTKDTYPYATVYDQQCSFYQFGQDQLSNEQYYARFNTKVDIGAAIGITRQHQVLLEHE